LERLFPDGGCYEIRSKQMYLRRLL
jgi:hypothetical protein